MRSGIPGLSSETFNNGKVGGVMTSIHSMTLEQISEAYLYQVSQRCARRCNPPGDVVECDWPHCSCDPYASIVIAQLEHKKLEGGECDICKDETE
ncbi:MAG: hypothetical protein GDA50_04335 [Alphaproteobacteria bacterium GM202ARS2]|nr:hypothetical protein [Alphaproteobacteria bacterium GM202ARS2]